MTPHLAQCLDQTINNFWKGKVLTSSWSSGSSPSVGYLVANDFAGGLWWGLEWKRTAQIPPGGCPVLRHPVVYGNKVILRLLLDSKLFMANPTFLSPTYIHTKGSDCISQTGSRQAFHCPSCRKLSVMLLICALPPSAAKLSVAKAP